MVLPRALSFARSLRSHRLLAAGGRVSASAMSAAAKLPLQEVGDRGFEPRTSALSGHTGAHDPGHLEAPRGARSRTAKGVARHDSNP
jgi:hypothetical protein